MGTSAGPAERAPSGEPEPASPAMVFAKGHGTQNDFVLHPDPDGHLDLGPDLVAALCDRRAGIGGDGVLRVVRSAALADGVEQSGQAEWFMDYRNADGSVAEMCGNGARVFVAYLVHAGLVDLPDGESLRIGTRAGVKRVRREGERFAVDLGPWSLPGGTEAARRGTDATVSLAGNPVPLPGLVVETGNPHTVVTLPDLDQLAAADLTRAPQVDPAPDGGTNVELVVPLHDTTSELGHLAMRVHERGVGETRSCGTGACATAYAALAAGSGEPDGPQQGTVAVDVPGGRLTVDVSPGTTVLRGPAVVVAAGQLTPEWLAA